MKKISVRLLTFGLCMIILFGSFGSHLSLNLTAEAVASFSVGDTVLFGSYPQTEIKDVNFLAELNSLNLEWISYGYHGGDGNGNVVPLDFMKYADVEYGGNKYRAVTFTKHRSTWTWDIPFDYSSLMSGLTEQYEYGYYQNQIYWFKYEPLRWRVLDPAECLLLCENVIDSQPTAQNCVSLVDSKDPDGDSFECSYFDDSKCTYYANDYSKSYVRKWLNDSFYNWAFSPTQHSLIKNSEVDNTAGGRCGFETYHYFDSETTFDKVFLLSYFDIIKTEYGFDSDAGEYDSTRQTTPTDYAKIQGSHQNTNEKTKYFKNAMWLLRSAGSESRYVNYVLDSGSCWDLGLADKTNMGTRPAIKLNDMSLNIKWNVHGEEFVQIYSEGEKIVPPETPEMQGYVSTWSADIPDYMPNESLEFTAYWTARTDTKYTVKTYTMEPDGKYTEKSEVLEGMTGALARAQYTVPENFVFNSAKSTLTGLIKADGSLVLKVYIDRQKFALTTVADGVSKTTRYYYGARIPEPAIPKKEGYRFTGWSPKIPETMPANDITVNAIFRKVYSSIKIMISSPETHTVKYGETLTLYASASGLPEGGKIKWSVADGSGVEIEQSSTGRICYVTSKSSGDVTVEAYAVNSFGNVICDENGNRFCDREYLYSQADLWTRIVFYLTKLFSLIK